MQLTKIEFKNFRSINDVTVDIKNRCTIFVGKNEAGKSNLLKAIAGGLNSDAYEITAKDKRKKGPNEIFNINDYYIKYYFNLSNDDINNLIDDYFDDEIYNNLFKLSGKTLTKEEFIEKHFSKGIYKYDISKLKGYGIPYAPSKSLVLTKRIAEIINDCSDNEGTNYTKGAIIDLGKTQIAQTNYKELSIDDTISLFTDNFRDFMENYLPETILWEYDDKYLIPNATPLQDFIKSPNNYLPLKNIFILAGYSNISKAFDDALAEDGDYVNLLDNVSRVATKEFAKKWPDLKKVQFVISKDGDELLAKVKEKVSYNFEDRSDGFKKFVSILLMLSTRVEKGIINDAIILIDEPDRSLYPTGAKYLRDELIKISDSNTVFYSTHSPFMIDKSNLDRHLIVEKSNEDITNIKEVSHSNFREDEVLLNAIGTTNFEFIQTNNIIFEGWGDNKLFKTALSSTKRNHRSIVDFFSQFGISFATGASDIKTITPLLKLADKNIFIFTDSDSASKNAKKMYQKDNGYMSQNWFTFEDLGGREDETLEDYIEDRFLKKTLNDLEIDIDLSQNTDNKPIMQYLYNKLNKDEKWKFKNYIANNMEPKDIKESYFMVLTNFRTKIENIVANLEQE